MKKLFFIAYFIACTSSATTLLPSQAESPVEQLVRIMMSNTNFWHQNTYALAKNRNPNDYQDIYNLATKHPKLLKGIIHDGRTFAMLCVQRGHADVLERLINEDCLVDLATPCNLRGASTSPKLPYYINCFFKFVCCVKAKKFFQKIILHVLQR